eukprot:jgi/Astpho2/2881/Aster-01035
MTSADGFAQINSGVARREAIELDSGSGLTATSWSQAGRLDLRPPSFGPDWNPSGYDPSGPKLAFVAMTSESYNQIHLWIQYHQAIGVEIFYLFVDGQAASPEVQKQLAALPGVQVIPRDEKLVERQANSRVWNETWLAAFFHKPCNHELFVRQSLNMEDAIGYAERDNIDWILHIDTDELLYPGGSNGFSLQRILGNYAQDVDTVVFPNYEAMPESEGVQDPFTEVTLFKRNYAHVESDSYFKSYHTVSRGNPNYFITYGNGKSAARIQPGLRPNGAHRWYNYFKAPNEQTDEQAAVLHYSYNKFEDLKSRRDRCDCAPTDEDAKRCFILPFDRMAFLAASLKSDEELMGWFKERLIWSDPAVVNDLTKSGLFVRIFAPQVMIRAYAAQNAHKGVPSNMIQTSPTLAEQDPAVATQLSEPQSSLKAGSTAADKLPEQAEVTDR